MQTTNPFDMIIERLEVLQSTVNLLSDNAQRTTSAPKNDPERLLDLPEAAAIVRKPVGTVRYYIHHRNLPATKIGKSYLIKLRELLNWINQFDGVSNKKKDPIQAMIDHRKRYQKD